MARTKQGLWVGSPSPSWQGQCGCKCPKSQTSVEPSHSLASRFMLWSWRTKSLSCSTWQIEQHNSHSNHQRRRHCHPKNGRWNESSPPKIGVGRSSMLATRCDGVLCFKDHLMVLKDFDLHRKIMDEAHCSRYSIHPGTNKMYQDLKKISGGKEWSER
jgi:hypothetical protein